MFFQICMEVWGFEPQTYGLQSHRSSQLSYTPFSVCTTYWSTHNIERTYIKRGRGGK